MAHSHHRFVAWILVGLSVLLLGASFVQAQEVVTSDADVRSGVYLEPLPEPLVTIHSTDRVPVGKAAIFDATLVKVPEGAKKIVYNWSFGDGNRDQGEEVVHSYSNSGEYEVAVEVMVDGVLYERRVVSIFAYHQLYLFLTDQSDEREKIASLQSFARDRGVLIRLLSNDFASSEFVVEEELFRQLGESSEDLKGADSIVVWTGGSAGLTVLSRFAQGLKDATVFKDKEVVIITSQNFKTIGNIAQGTFRTIHPTRMILTRPEALWMLFEQSTIQAFVQELMVRGVQFEVISEQRGITPFNFMSFFVNYMVERGVPSNSLLLILMLPVIVTIVAFLKQVIGLTTLGVYTPSIIALSFVALGIQFGFLIFVLILFFGTLTRLFLRRYRLLYIPRMSIVLTIVSLTILFFMLIGAYFNISQLVSLSVFPMLIMSTMVEKFVNIQSERGFHHALIMIASTLFVAVICYFVVEWSLFKTLIFGHPEIIFLFLVMNVFLGRWTGLRLLEYVRFREIFTRTEDEE